MKIHLLTAAAAARAAIIGHRCKSRLGSHVQVSAPSAALVEAH